MFFSERQNHAHEMIKEYDLDKIDGILISSGDGVLYEVRETLVCYVKLYLLSE